MGATQFGIGALQGLIGGFKTRKANKELERLDANAPKYTANKGIMDFYGKALERYGVSPTASAMYKRQQQNIGRGVSGAIGALQDRRSGQAGISSILRASNDASLNAEAAAEQRRDTTFGQLGNAAQMQAGEQRMEFDVNQQQPFERKYNRLSQKAGAAAQLTNSGITNAVQGIGNVASMYMLDNAYGDSGGRGGSGTWNSGDGTGMTGINNDFRLKNRRRKY